MCPFWGLDIILSIWSILYWVLCVFYIVFGLWVNNSKNVFVWAYTLNLRGFQKNTIKKSDYSKNKKIIVYTNEV